ncbi:MAG: flagellar hook-basal body complex protein, partial [Armatimonadetes bacterium]|nr:flagellar hook-basal body complex protein [Armatimonadota bacterium]
VTTVSVYDSLSEMHTVTLTFTKTANQSEWQVDVACEGDTGTATITFDAQGQLTGGESVTLNLTPDNGAQSPQSITFSLEDLTCLREPYSVAVQSQDGRPAAALVAVELTDDGYVQGQYSDGRSEVLAQLALASFTNPGGLRRIGSNLYAEAPAAGIGAVGGAGTGGRGRIVAQALEMSNVDLTKAFVDMITTQRGFQASTRVIATANEMLDDVVRLIRT